MAALLAATAAASASLAYEPEIGKTIDAFPIVHSGGRPLDWNADGASFRILIIGATWCEPCQALRASLPGELARLRQQGISVSTIFVEADEFGAAAANRPPRDGGTNPSGYVEAAPDPARIDLSRESPRGVRDWGAFRAYGYPTTILLDNRNAVVERYRGGSASRGVFGVVGALANRMGAVAGAPLEMGARGGATKASLEPSASVASLTKPTAPDRAEEQAGDELIGLWKINNPQGKDPLPLFLRVIGVNPTMSGAMQLEASLSHKLSKWMPVPARCEIEGSHCILRVTTHNGGELTARRQADGSYAGAIAFAGRAHGILRPITMMPMSLDEAEL